MTEHIRRNKAPEKENCTDGSKKAPQVFWKSPRDPHLKKSQKKNGNDASENEFHVAKMVKEESIQGDSCEDEESDEARNLSIFERGKAQYFLGVEGSKEIYNQEHPV